VTPVGLGLAALGRPAYINVGRPAELGPDRDVAIMEQRSHRMLDAAYAAGIRYVDVARSYGRAEEFLASWLDARDIGPGAITVGSKWGYRYTGDWRMDGAVQEVKDHSLAMFHRQYAETTALLGTHLGLYQVHSATPESGVLDDRAVLGALAGLRHTGVAVGLTVSGPHQADVVRRALEVDVDGANPFSTVQATWNLLEPSAGAALAAAHERGWGVIVKEVLANGRLTDAAHDPAAGPGARVAERRRASLEQVAFAAALVQPWADVVLSGAVDPGQLDTDLRAVEEASPHPSALGSAPAEDSPLAQEAAGLAAMAEPPGVYWQRRSGLPWH